MLLHTIEGSGAITQQLINEFLQDIATAIPRVLSGVLFLVLAYLAIKLVLLVARGIFNRLYREDEGLIVDVWVTVVGVFLWFGVALALLKIVGLGEVATSLGTAAGFIGLGIAFALKEMIADTVAGIYLIQDRDFNQGDRVETASVTGTITDIDLRKTRIRSEDGDLIVVPNREVEKKWRTQLA